MKECNYCKKMKNERELNNTNLGYICLNCYDSVQKKVNVGNKPIAYFRELLTNNIKF